ncbi:MAG: hypothetical protein H6P96_440 [Candidatus Aminicenantes bacterium]|nr:hypothetical protein [Candidatus Aminicenantes bacterium]
MSFSRTRFSLETAGNNPSTSISSSRRSNEVSVSFAGSAAGQEWTEPFSSSRMARRSPG